MHILAISQGLGFEPASWKAVLRSGIDAFMLREATLSTRELLDLTRRVQDLAPELTLWVNGRLDVALACGTGFHGPEAHPNVPRELVPLSRPLHAPAQTLDRWSSQQLLVSPVHEVPGKGSPWGAAALRSWLDTLPPMGPRLLALGGLEPSRLPDLKHPRLGGIALIRALWASADPASTVEELRNSWV